VLPVSSSVLRQDLSVRNSHRAERHEHELTYGEVPSIIYLPEDDRHGNFVSASYKAICAHPEWRKRLNKHYTGSKWVPRSGDRRRRELDCANSSDALLMNIFCYPKVFSRPQVRALLGINAGLRPVFGYKPRVLLVNGRGDQTEVDMRLGNLLVEAKLTESGFQSAPVRLLLRYRDFNEVFDVDVLKNESGTVHGYQLIRGVLAAYATQHSFSLLCDGRRADLIEAWFEVTRAVRSYSFRSRLKLLTWQEVSRTVPKGLRRFLDEKYGIA
jgi:hypothetical protein